ncbi:MAG: ImmA/IrrE family metallo-endopeptidase [Candidatus Igneacidithiobacillus chanchocoensis]
MISLGMHHLTRNDVAQVAACAARDWLEKHGLHRIAPPIPVKKIAESLGFIVTYRNLSNPQILGFYMHGVIGVNLRNQSHTRGRFSLAHELGHAVWHPHQRYTCLNGDLGLLEIEANTFAAELLMPQADFLHRIAPYRDLGLLSYIDDLAVVYAVSREAVWWRLADLGIWTRSQVKAQIRHAGLKLSDPVAQQIAPAK